MNSATLLRLEPLVAARVNSFASIGSTGTQRGTDFESECRASAQRFETRSRLKLAPHRTHVGIRVNRLILNIVNYGHSQGTRYLGRALGERVTRVPPSHITSFSPALYVISTAGPPVPGTSGWPENKLSNAPSCWVVRFSVLASYDLNT